MKTKKAINFELILGFLLQQEAKGIFIYPVNPVDEIMKLTQTTQTKKSFTIERILEIHRITIFSN